MISFANIVGGRAVFLLGSSPAADIARRPDGAVLIACNGSLTPFPGLVPDILVINSYTVLRKDEVGRASMDALRGRHARHLVLITSGMAFDAMRAELSASGLTWDSDEELDKTTRRAIVEATIGHAVASAHGNDVASTGVSALAWARRCGAKSLSQSGISRGRGHSYMPGETPRNHLNADIEVMAALGLDFD